MSKPDFPSLLNNKILLERSRLLILSCLMGTETNSATFMELQKSLNLTRGNLSIQIKRLGEAKYVAIEKKFKNNKPLTTVSITEKGILAIKEHLNEMEKIIKLARSLEN